MQIPAFASLYAVIAASVKRVRLAFQSKMSLCTLYIAIIAILCIHAKMIIEYITPPLSCL